jgi:hypothetical protein
VIFGIVTSPIVFGRPGVSLRSDASTVKTSRADRERCVIYAFSLRNLTPNIIVHTGRVRTPIKVPIKRI